MKLSIIVPVYNVAAYLRKCLNSCLHQDLPPDQYEVIMVDDGSTDGCGAIGREYRDRYPQFRLYSQSNSGQSVARNLGLTKARGEYIWFIDGDDWIKPEVLAGVVDSCDRDQLDMLGFSGVEVEAGGEAGNTREEIYDRRRADSIMSGKDFLIGYDATTCTPLYLFRYRFLENNRLRFLPGVFFEDEDFIYRALYACRKIGFTNEALYCVNLRDNSSTRRVNPKKSFDLIKVAASLSAFLQREVEPRYRAKFHTRIGLLLNKSLDNVQAMNAEQTEELNRVLYDHRQLFRHLRRSCLLKDRIEGWCFSLFPRHTVKIFTLLHRE